MFLAIALLAAGAAIYIFVSQAIPVLDEKRQVWHAKKEQVVEQELDKMFRYDGLKQIMRLYYILPPVFGLAGWMLSGNVVMALAGGILGLFIPNFILKMREQQRRLKFNNQILDAIMILSSSLKGGLSLLQALEVLTEEMAAPMSQEIGLVIRENKMGIALDEALRSMEKRMKMEELSLVINSVLVARETGGDLTKVFSRLCTTIRDNRKLKDNIKTLTLQGRLQGIIMSALPLVFVWWIVICDKHHFDYMLKSELGRGLLLAAVVLQFIGMFLIRKFSTIKI